MQIPAAPVGRVLIEERFGVVYHERTIGKILKQIGFSHISARPRHPGQKIGKRPSGAILAAHGSRLVMFRHG